MTLTTGAPAAESPTAEDIEANAAAPADAAASTDANPAASSDADDKDAKEPADLLSVVKSAVEKPEEAAAPSAAEGEGEAKTEATEGEPAKGELTPEAQAEADAKLPFHQHPRWKEVIAERDGYREDAVRYRNIEGFMQQHGLSADEVAEGYTIMAALKSGDPSKLGEVRDYFATRLAFLDEHLGNVLPDDLRERVDSGALDEESAQELAKVRASEKLRTKQLEQREERDTQAEAERSRVAAATAMATAVDEWEQRQKASDPDYPKKAELVETTARAIIQRTGKIPANAQEAIALSEQALKEVNDRIGAIIPKRQPVHPSPRGSSAPTASQPKTLKEAIAASLSR